MSNIDREPLEGARQRCWMWSVRMKDVPDSAATLPPALFALLPCDPIGRGSNVKKYATREEAMHALGIARMLLDKIKAEAV